MTRSGSADLFRLSLVVDTASSAQEFINATPASTDSRPRTAVLLACLSILAVVAFAAVAFLVWF